MRRRRASNSTRRIIAYSKWIFVKFINKVLQRWRNHENSKVLPSIRTQDGSSSRIRTLFWNYQAEYEELQNEVNCMNDSEDFQDAESVRSRNSHVTSRSVSFPPHPILEGIVEAFFRIVAPQKRAAMHFGYTWYIGKRFCKSTCVLFSSLYSRIESMGDDPLRNRFICLQRRKVKDQNKIKI